MNILHQAAIFLSAADSLLDTTEQEVKDFLASFLREFPDVLVVSTKELVTRCYDQWAINLPSPQMFDIMGRVKKRQSIQEALLQYMIGNPAFTYRQGAKGGWRINRKVFFQAQADIITV